MTIGEAAEHYASVTDPEAHGIDFIREVFIAGAEWQKEQMMKSAVEADVNIHRDIVAGKKLAEFIVEMPTNNLGKKVRVIIIYEKEN